MNRSIQTLGIIGATLLLSFCLWQNAFAQYNLSNTPVWVKINYVAKETAKYGPSMYVELEIKNRSNKSIILTTVQQGSLDGPDDIFLIKNSRGENVRTPFEMREHFGPNGRELNSGEMLYRYYKSPIDPTLMDENLHFSFGVSTIGHGSFVTESIWAVLEKWKKDHLGLSSKLFLTSSWRWIQPSIFHNSIISTPKTSLLPYLLLIHTKNTLYRVFLCLSFSSSWPYQLTATQLLHLSLIHASSISGFPNCSTIPVIPFRVFPNRV